MADPMRIRANNKDGVTEVRVLMSHVMESGARKDAAGATIPVEKKEVFLDIARNRKAAPQ